MWHETAGAYGGSVAWLENPAAQASAHLVVREDGLQATQLVHLADKAWHAAAFNGWSVGVEHANITAKGYATEKQLQVSARIFGWLCLHLGVPHCVEQDRAYAGDHPASGFGAGRRRAFAVWAGVGGLAAFRGDGRGGDQAWRVQAEVHALA